MSVHPAGDSGPRLDAAIVGGGAAGLAAAIFAARARPGRAIAVLDGAHALGAKILVSGGGRCNVTNAEVTAGDFWQPRSPFVRRVLRSFGAQDAAAFFREIGVALHEEEDGKLFPDANRARCVLEALLGEARRLGVQLRTENRVREVVPVAGGFRLATTARSFLARRVVLATGGLSLPKTGSDGGGYAIARGLGHSIVPTTPALAPLVLDGAFHVPLSGVAHDVEIAVRIAGQRPTRIRGALLWTHFGASGPAPMNASRFWHRARIEGRDVRVVACLVPGLDFAAVEQRLLALAAERPGLALKSALATLLPAAVADALPPQLGIASDTPLGRLKREERRRVVAALVEWPLPVRDSRGYNFAEATSGGVPLSEVDAATMESRCRPGLHLVGEILDVDGRIGGFNFQWAWSTGFVAGRALARLLGTPDPVPR